MKRFAATFALALPLLAATWQSAAAQATVPVWREMVIYATDTAYPADLARRGVQGDAVVEVAIQRGRARFAAVRSSSRNAELDRIALRIAQRLDIRALDNAARTGLVKISFKKDHASTIASKTCADFNVDAAYQAAIFPERQVRELPVMAESIGKLVYSLHRLNTGKSFPGIDPVLNATVASCARTPEAGMLDVMRQEALKLISD